MKKCIPSFLALYKAIELLIITSLYAQAVKPILKLYQFYFSDKLTLIYFSLVLFILSFVLAIFVYGFIHQFLWGDPDPNPQHLKFLPANKSMMEACFMFCFSILTTIITVFIMLPFYDEFYYDNKTFLNLINIDGKENNLKIATLIIWLFVSTYLYHFKFLIPNQKRITK